MSKSSYRRNGYLINKAPTINIKAIEEKKEMISEVKEEEIISPREPIYQATVIYPSLRKRDKPSFSGKEIGLITDKGKYNIYAIEGKWGQLEDNSWICLDYTSR